MAATEDIVRTAPCAGEDKPPPLPIMHLGDLIRQCPRLRPPVIDGLLRRGETMNIIAPPKIGKTWLTYSLLLSVATGRPWLDTFAVEPGKVLLIDNELHKETCAHRIPMVAKAMGVDLDDVGRFVDVVNLRGCLQDLEQLHEGLLQVEHGCYNLVVIDAFYRTLPAGKDENSNADMAALYNMLDSIAETTESAFALVHHASKGDQSAKAITDVGAGAGAQSRATDTHMVLRKHQEDGVVVLDAAVRSWPSISPLCLRWKFPLWTPELELDATALHRARTRRPAEPKQEKPKKEVWTAKRFAEAFGTAEPQSGGAILERAKAAGISDRAAKSCFKNARDCGHLHEWSKVASVARWATVTEPPAIAPSTRRAAKKQCGKAKPNELATKKIA